MEEFTIYYGTLPDGRNKIGVDSNYPTRINQQKLTNYRVLEVHTDVYEVSKREQELQQQYDVKVDTCPYHVVYFVNLNRQGYKMTAEQKQKISIAHTGKTRSEEHVNNLAQSLTGKRRTKEHKKTISKSKVTTTPETDVLVVTDHLLGMSLRKLAVKHNLSFGTVRRIIRNMNE